MTEAIDRFHRDTQGHRTLELRKLLRRFIDDAAKLFDQLRAANSSEAVQLLAGSEVEQGPLRVRWIWAEAYHHLGIHEWSVGERFREGIAQRLHTVARLQWAAQQFSLAEGTMRAACEQWDENRSVELRVPFAYTIDSMQLDDPVTAKNTELGNLTVTLKNVLVARDPPGGRVKGMAM